MKVLPLESRLVVMKIDEAGRSGHSLGEKKRSCPVTGREGRRNVVGSHSGGTHWADDGGRRKDDRYPCGLVGTGLWGWNWG